MGRVGYGMLHSGWRVECSEGAVGGAGQSTGKRGTPWKFVVLASKLYRVSSVADVTCNGICGVDLH